ncbi:hypothetical protein EFE33_03145 [Lactiplantibacillus plantarum]|nr:hypothetical protein [Lactiplantibacillus plantarum]
MLKGVINVSKVIDKGIDFFIKPFIGNVNNFKGLSTTQPSIFIANHSSYLDHFVMMYLFRKANPNKRLYFLTKKEAFDKPLSRKWHKSLNTIPVNRDGNDIRAIKRILDVLESKNSSVMIYPEGTRTANGLVDKGKLGAAFIAMTSKVPITPVGLNGIFDVLPKYRILPKLKKVSVSIGDQLEIQSQNRKELTTEFENIWSKVIKLSGEISKEDTTIPSGLKPNEYQLQVAHWYNEQGIRHYPNAKLKPNQMHKRAIYITKELLKQNYEPEKSLYEQARAYGRLGSNSTSFLTSKYYLGKAEKKINKALTIVPDYGPAQYVKATLRLWNHDLNSALSYFKAANENLVNQVYVKIAYAKALVQDGNYTAAQQLLSEIMSAGKLNQVDERRRHEAAALLMRLSPNVIV